MFEFEKSTFLGVFIGAVKHRGRDTHHLDGLDEIITEALVTNRRVSITQTTSIGCDICGVGICDKCVGEKLLSASADGDQELALQCLKFDGLDINCLDSDMATPLHIATSHGQIGVVKELLACKDTHKLDVNVRDGSGFTPLMIAVQTKKIQCMDLLTAAGANVNLRTTSGAVALHYAILNRDERMVQRLLLKGGTQKFARAMILPKSSPMTPYELARFLFMEDLAVVMMDIVNQKDGGSGVRTTHDDYETDEEEEGDGGGAATFVYDRHMTDAQIKGAAPSVVELCRNEGNSLATVLVEEALKDLGYDPTHSDIKALLVEVDRSYDVHVSKCDVVRPRGSPILSAELLPFMATAFKEDAADGLKFVPKLLNVCRTQSASAAARLLWDHKADHSVGDFIGDPVISFNPTGSVVSGIFHFGKALEGLNVRWQQDTPMLLLARCMGGGTAILLLVLSPSVMVYLVAIEEVVLSLMDTGLRPLNLDEGIAFALESDCVPIAENVLRGGLPQLQDAMFESYKKKIFLRINSCDIMVGRKKLLYHAVAEGDVKLVQLLLKIDSSIVSEMPELLVTACTKNFQVIVNELLSAGAPVNAMDVSTGETPLTACVRADSAAILATVLQHKANVDLLNANGYTPLNLACYLNLPCSITCALQLVRRGANANILGPNDNSALVNAVMTDTTGQLVFHLLSNKADKFIENKSCLSPYLAALLTSPNMCPSLLRPDMQVIAPPDVPVPVVKKMHMITITVINISRMFFPPENEMFPPMETVRAALEGSVVSAYPEQKQYLPYIQAQLGIARRSLASLLCHAWSNQDDETIFLAASLEHACERLHESLQSSEYGTRFPDGVQECVTLSANVAMRSQRLVALQEFQPLPLFHLCGVSSAEYAVWLTTVGKNTICATRVGPFLHSLQLFCNFPSLRYGWRQRAVSDFVDPSGSCWTTILEFALLCKMFPMMNHGLEDLCNLAATGAFDAHMSRSLIPHRLKNAGDYVVCVDCSMLSFVVFALAEESSASSQNIVALEVQSSMLGYWRVGSAQGKTFVEALEASPLCVVPKGRSYNVEV